MSSSLNIADATPEQVSNHRLARLAGLLYFSMLPTTDMGVFSAQSLLANGGSAAAAQITASRSFLELGVLVGAVGFVTWLVVAVLFYLLFHLTSDRACKLLVVQINCVHWSHAGGCRRRAELPPGLRDCPLPRPPVDA